MPDKPFPALLSKDDLCASLGISRRTIEKMVRDGTFPPPVRLGKCVYWSEVAVHSWRRRLFAGQEAWRLSSLQPRWTHSSSGCAAKPAG